MQRAHRRAFRQRIVGEARALHRLVRNERDDGVYRRIDPCDAIEVRRERFARRHFLRANPSGELSRRQLTDKQAPHSLRRD